MSDRPLHRCNAPGCKALVRTPRCELHAKQQRREADKSRTKDIFYCGRPWRRLRENFLQSNPLCADCQANGRIAAAAEVHHVEPRRDAPERQYDVENLMGLCKSCHSRRTARGE